MEWLESLFFGGGIAHSILVLAMVVFIGLLLGKIKIKGISLGVTWILFVGIAVSHFGLVIHPTVLQFIREFGLILFIYSLGLQVGPGFFSSFKKGGLSLNLLALSLIILTGVTTYLIHLITGTSISTMVGIMSGAVTNTPGLGAAQQALMDIKGVNDPSIAMGYAVAYPLGVVGVILSILIIRPLFRVNLEKERAATGKNNVHKESAKQIAIEVLNEELFGKTIVEIDNLSGKKFIVSRLYHQNGKTEIPTSTSVIEKGDKLLMVTSSEDESSIVSFWGKKLKMRHGKWENLDTHLVSRRLLVTQSAVDGKTLGELKIRAQYGINITRVNRSGIDLVATPNLHLQLGDRVMVVGNEEAIKKVEGLLGNSLKKLREPNLIPIFLGIFLGVLVGSIPIVIPGIPQPVKLGLAGGPLIIAILISRFGARCHIHSYTTMSANMMLREVGMSLFLAAVGLGAGEGFVEAIIGGGYIWVVYGLIITLVPIFIVATIGRLAFKLDFFSLAGLICGSQTNPIALSFSNNTYGVPQTAVIYATVYPLAMFLRVLLAQIMVL